MKTTPCWRLVLALAALLPLTGACRGDEELLRAFVEGSGSSFSSAAATFVSGLINGAVNVVLTGGTTNQTNTGT
jgi:hypothetical protein